MGFNLEGSVLRPGRVATSNSATTGEATTSVDQHHEEVADLQSWFTSGMAPSRPVAPYADMYRAAVVESAGQDTEQFCLFAASNGSFSDLDDLPTFWWTRNDRVTRFGWDGQAGRWYPFKGRLPTNLGPVKADTTYTLAPPPAYSQGEVLPFTPSDPDDFALVRAGQYSDSDSTPLNVYVVADTLIEDGLWIWGTTYDLSLIHIDAADE